MEDIARVSLTDENGSLLVDVDVPGGESVESSCDDGGLVVDDAVSEPEENLI